MVLGCKDYEQKGYCIRGEKCPYQHGDDLIRLDISGYKGLIEAARQSSIQVAALTKEQQNELKRKQADLLNNLIGQQRALVKRIELCTDDAEKLRLKTALDEMLQKTKDWIKQEGARNQRTTK